MGELTSSPSDFDLHSLFEACAREATHAGGDNRTAQYFFVRAQSSRVWISSRGEVTVADMDIADWCAAITWSAPGVGRPPKRAPKRANENAIEQQDEAFERKQSRSGSKFRRSSIAAASQS